MSTLKRPVRKVKETVASFVTSEASGGIVLMLAAAAALIIANTPWSTLYFDTLHHHVLHLSVTHWVNDGLMSVFFLLVGLEIKREMLSGRLAEWNQRILPGLAALGGMIVPALIYLFVNRGHGHAVNGWAIPAATDIAFALGVLSLLGDRVPNSLKLFLAALAIIDDLGAVVIIAAFYSSDLSLPMLAAAAGVMVLLIMLNRMNVRALTPYLLLGAVLWYFVFQSGVHATLAGVLLALTIPLGDTDEGEAHSPLLHLEESIANWVAFLIVPLFGFANAGVSLAGISARDVLDTIPLGVALGLLLGKQIGVMLFSSLAISLGWARLPDGASRRQLYAVSLLCGIGFTMSLFIGSLAFADAPHLIDEVKIGVLSGSILSALLGALLFCFASRKQH